MNQCVQWCVHGCYINTTPQYGAGIHLEFDVKQNNAVRENVKIWGIFERNSGSEGAHCGEVEIGWYQW